MGVNSSRMQPPASQPLLPQYPPMPLQSAQTLSQIGSTVTLQNNACIDRNSLSLRQSQEQPEIHFLEATYSANQDCAVAVHFFCSEVQDPSSGLRFFRSNPAYFPQPLQIPLRQGYHQPLPAQSIAINFSQHTGLLAFQDQTVYPLVLEIRPNGDASQCHTSLICFTHEAGQWKVKLLQQRLFAYGRYFVLHEMFGVQRQHLRDEESPECVVCMTDRKNTAVLPCRHMCLCGSCANIVRSQPVSKCPICRCQVDSLLQLVVQA